MVERDVGDERVDFELVLSHKRVFAKKIEFGFGHFHWLHRATMRQRWRHEKHAREWQVKIGYWDCWSMGPIFVLYSGFLCCIRK